MLNGTRGFEESHYAKLERTAYCLSGAQICVVILARLLSRSWMLEGIASRLGAADRRSAPLIALAGKLKRTGLDSIKSEHYEGGHWLGSFAVYLTTRRGLQPHPASGGS
jgi:hypothetical protein